MNRVTIRVITALLVVVSMVSIVGCSPTRKILNTGDPELIYEHAMLLYDQENWGKSAQLFEEIEPYFSGSLREDSILFYSARATFKNRDYEIAATSLDEFRRKFGRSTFLEDAEGIYTLCYYYMAPGSTRDQSVTKTAISTIDDFVARYPESEQRDAFIEMRADLMSRLHEKSYLNAYSYYKIRQYKSAIIAFRNAMREFPESVFREDLSYYVVASGYELARNSIASKEEDRYLQMIDSYYTFISEFPESKYRSSVDHMLDKARSFLARRGVEEEVEDEEINIFNNRQTADN